MVFIIGQLLPPGHSPLPPSLRPCICLLSTVILSLLLLCILAHPAYVQRGSKYHHHQQKQQRVDGACPVLVWGGTIKCPFKRPRRSRVAFCEPCQSVSVRWPAIGIGKQYDKYKGQIVSSLDSPRGRRFFWGWNHLFLCWAFDLREKVGEGKWTGNTKFGLFTFEHSIISLHVTTSWLLFYILHFPFSVRISSGSSVRIIIISIRERARRLVVWI